LFAARNASKQGRNRMSDESAPLHLVKYEGAERSPLEEAPSNKSLLGQPVQHEHLLHLYEKEALLYDAVTHFASAGLAAGEPVILIATEVHRRELIHRLRLKGCRIEDAMALGQLALLDARHTLSRFMVGEEPDWDKFSSVIGAVIEQSRQGRRDARVRVFGEMVDLLWCDGKKQAAIRLEEMWNELARLHSFSLLCSYKMGNFYKAGDEELVDKVNRAHSDAFSPQSASVLDDRARTLEKEIEHRKELEAALRAELKRRAGAHIQADDERRRVEENSELGEERFRLLVESVQDYAIFLLDSEGRIISWNIGAERIKGYRAEEIIGEHFSIFYPEQDVRAGKCEYELEIAAREARFEDEGWRVRKDGSRFWANVIISRMINREGRLIGFAKVTRDLTERRALEEERIARAKAEVQSIRLAKEGERLEQALADQKSRDELREQLLGVVGHDLRSPLSSISMASALMLRRGTLHDADAKTVARIARSADRMSKIISQLLDFTRARLGGGLPINPKLTDLAEVCQEVIAEFETANPDRVLCFDSDLNTKGLWDRDRLAQVVTNLIGNAIQHGKLDGSIDVLLRDEGDAVCLLVHNDGSPIPDDLLPSIFDPFRRGRTRATQKAEGLGLGLFIVREMVRAHSGEISVQSTEAQGTTFTVKLPRRPLDF
jgi:PAS domain S-box-containing protein